MGVGLASETRRWFKEFEKKKQQETGEDMSMFRGRIRKQKHPLERGRASSVPVYLPSKLHPIAALRMKRFGNVSPIADIHVDEGDSSDTESNAEGSDAGFNPVATLLKITQTGDVTTAIASIYKDRRVFRTKNRNFVGMGHECVKKGDVVALVAGANTPFVFRRVGDGSPADVGEQRFTLVGSAYVHGIMYGELMERYSSSVEFQNIVVV
jgi:hypothetical protein